MTPTKSVLNMAAYAIVLVLILMMGLAILKARGTAKESANESASAAELARATMDALDAMEQNINARIDAAVAARVEQLNKTFEEKLNCCGRRISGTGSSWPSCSARSMRLGRMTVS